MRSPRRADSAPVYLIGIGEFPDVRGVEPAFVERLSAGSHLICSFKPADFEKATGKVVDASGGRQRAVLFL
jgi:hypothetical protein